MTEVSVIIPVHNEEGILVSSVGEMLAFLRSWGVPGELILAENGSRDRTAALATELESQHAEVRLVQVGSPNYGEALRRGIQQARGCYVHCDEIDIGDEGFHRRARELLTTGKADVVVGSKTMPGAHDRRPWVRRLATRVINGLLGLALGYRGTDTHGLKAFHRETVLPIVEQCLLDRDMFATELLIRAQRAGLRIAEIPVFIEEKRAPSIDLFRRVPRVIGQLIRLWGAIGR